MGNFRDNRGGGGGRNFGPRRDFGGDRGYGRPQMHKATCASCGKECEVPFRPTGERPVYCSDCFEKQGGGERKSFGRDDRGPRNSFRNEPRVQQPQNRQELDAINAKLDKILKLLQPEVAEEVFKEEPEAQAEPEKVVKKKRVTKKEKVEAEPETPQEVEVSSPETPTE